MSAGNQSRVDSWGWTDPTIVYSGEMAAIQHRYQQRSLARLRQRLEAKGISWDYQHPQDAA